MSTSLILKACKNADTILGPPQFISCLFKVALSFPSLFVIWLFGSKFNEYQWSDHLRIRQQYHCREHPGQTKNRKKTYILTASVLFVCFCVFLNLVSVFVMQEISD